MAEIIKAVKSRLVRKCPLCKEKYTSGFLLKVTDTELYEYCKSCSKKLTTVTGKRTT